MTRTTQINHFPEVEIVITESADFGFYKVTGGVEWSGMEWTSHEDSNIVMSSYSLFTIFTTVNEHFSLRVRNIIWSDGDDG